MHHNGVIAAIATAWGESAIAVIRLSGAGSVEIADKFFRGRTGKPLAAFPARFMTLGAISDKSGGTVDEVLAVRFEEGKSYTGEESAEIHCHGGIAAVQRCLELFLAGGARLAVPGEFTKRAFLSGRIDLTQAEAVLGVIRSKSDASLLSAERSLQGEFSSRARELMDLLTAFRAGLEVRLDYPEEIDGQENSEITRGIEEISSKASELAERCRIGLTLSGGVKAAILGSPNVGKSSLLNALVGEERAIVTKIPGTTRDTVAASTVWRGLAIEFVDTAGIRKTEDEIESIGISRSLEAMSGADIRIVVIDSSSGITAADMEVISSVFKQNHAKGRAKGSAKGTAKDAAKSVIIAMNKRDLPQYADENGKCLIPPRGINDIDEIKSVNIVKTSALSGEGIAELKDAIFNLALGSASAYEGYAATERTASAISEAAFLIGEAKDAIKHSLGADVAGSLLAEASEAISSVLGADATEELLDAIFSNFCVGK
jgi:tRNA modification GTPase